MSKCRYDLLTDCYNRDCLSCVLDKIRAEIEKARNTEIKEFNEETDIVEPTSYQRGSHEGYDEAITDVLQIIDKHKAESEG